jgi:putative ABC transport system substrate-binding protein
MKRRTLLAALVSGFLFAPSFAAELRAGVVTRIGVLIPGSRSFFMNRFSAFRDGLRSLGYVEGKNLHFEYRYADGKLDQLPGLAAELVAIKVDLIFSAGAESIIAAKKATQTIPIVFGTVQDPLASGIVASLARPGGNATGMSALSPDLGQKRLELLKETAPGIRRVAFLWSPVAPSAGAGLSDMQAAAKLLGLELQSLEVRGTQDLVNALESARKAGAQALITNPDPAINAAQEHIVAFAALHRLPAMYAAPEAMDVGGLMAYSPHYGDLWRRAATLADKILKGTKPADLPVEQPTRFDLRVNMKTAKALGITIPPTILVRADKVIE